MNSLHDPLFVQTANDYGGGGLMADSGEIIELFGEDLEPQQRDRCNTWPRRRPSVAEDLLETSPIIHQRINEDDEHGSLCDSSGDLTRLEVPAGASLLTYNSDQQNPWVTDISSSPDELSPSDTSSPAKRITTTRRNAWGNMSYADLISHAIMSTPDKRLTLSQIYDWMVQNIPYFRDKGDSNSSAGWKNSIRHNLSLHQRFMRMQNEGAGKSSWWVINPDAKPGKASRRRAHTMEAGAKALLDKKRGRVRKRVEQLKAAGSKASLTAASVDEGGGDDSGAPAADYRERSSCHDQFRQRSDSNLSNYSTPGGMLGSSSQLPSNFDDLDVYWALNPNQSNGDPILPADVVGMTGNIRLTNDVLGLQPQVVNMGGGAGSSGAGTPRMLGGGDGSPNKNGSDKSSPQSGSGGAVDSPFPSSVISYQTRPVDVDTAGGGVVYATAPPAYHQLYPSTAAVDASMSPLFHEAVFKQQQQQQQLQRSPPQQQQPAAGMIVTTSCGAASVYQQPQMFATGDGGVVYQEHHHLPPSQMGNGGVMTQLGGANAPPLTATQSFLPQDLSGIEISNPLLCNMDEVLIHEFNLGTRDFNTGTRDFNTDAAMPFNYTSN